jgi:integrase
MTATTFKSHLAKDMCSYVELKQSLGMKAANIEKNLRLLDGFLIRRHAEADDVSLPILEDWFTENPELHPATRALRLSVVRQFCLYRRRTDADVYVPDKRATPMLWPARVPRHRPYIFTAEEVKRLLRAALELRPYLSNPHRPRTFFNLLLLLYTTGLRISEAHALCVGDVDWSAGTLLVRESKFFKTRLVPVARDVLASLRDYHALLDLPRGDAALPLPFFQKGRRRSYSLAGFQEVGLQLLRRAGLKPAVGHVGPRLHDLRHAFAVRCIERWYADGRDVQNLLPRLATYMGHKNIASTQYYITVTVAILHRAGERFERACAPGRRA